MRTAPYGSVEHPPRLDDHEVKGYNRLLGLAYRRVKNRYIAGLQLVKTREVPGHGSWWMVLDRTVDTGITRSAPDAGKAETFPQEEQGTDLSKGGVPGEKPRSGVRLVRLTDKPSYVKNSHNAGTSVYMDGFSSDGTGGSNKLASPNSPPARAYSLYPHYPTTEGADPLASLLPLAVDVPAPECPDCDQPEELVPGAHWFACPRCHPGTFSSRLTDE
jgi:hypothetical protein